MITLRRLRAAAPLAMMPPYASRCLQLRFLRLLMLDLLISLSAAFMPFGFDDYFLSLYLFLLFTFSFDFLSDIFITIAIDVFC